MADAGRPPLGGRVHYAWYFREVWAYHGELRATEGEAARDLLTRLWDTENLFYREFERLPGYFDNPQYDNRVVDDDDNVAETAPAFLQNNIENYVARREACFYPNLLWFDARERYIACFRDEVVALLDEHCLGHLMEYAKEDTFWGVETRIPP